MIHYYFNENKTRIFDFETELPSGVPFMELTDAQLSFMKSNANVSAMEIYNCKINEIITQPKSIEDMKDDAIKELSDYSLKTLGKFVSAYQLANAQTSLLLSENKIYDDTKSNEYIATYSRIGLLCRNKFYGVKSQIELSETIEAINTIVMNAKSYYDGIE